MTALISLVHQIEDKHAWRDKLGRIHMSVLMATPKETKRLHHMTANFPDGSGVKPHHKHLTKRQKHFCQYYVNGDERATAYAKSFGTGKVNASVLSRNLLARNKVGEYVHYLRIMKQKREAMA